MSPSLRVLIMVLAFAGALPGCAPWAEETPPKSLQLPAPRMSADSVVLEVAFLEVPPNIPESELWGQLDEQHLANDLRRSLLENGMRCGLAGEILPERLRKLLEQQQNALPRDEQGGAVVSTQMPMRLQRLQSRAGRRHTLPVNQTPKDIHVLTRDKGQVRGQTCTQAQCMFVLRTFPLPDGRVRIELTPEIEHGQARQQFTGQHEQGMWMIESRREQQVFENLQVEALLAPGQTLVLGSTLEPKGVGQHFFGTESSSGPQQRLMLVRLAQTQLDGLYQRVPSPEPIATPGS